MESETEWTSKGVKLLELKEKAHEWDFGVFISGSEELATMVNFLKFAEVIPRDVVWVRKNSLPRTALNKDAIPASYLAEVAAEWDDDGFSTAEDFVNALEFEVYGTAKNNLVSEVMEDLGRR